MAARHVPPWRIAQPPEITCAFCGGSNALTRPWCGGAPSRARVDVSIVRRVPEPQRSAELRPVVPGKSRAQVQPIRRLRCDFLAPLAQEVQRPRGGAGGRIRAQ